MVLKMSGAYVVEECRRRNIMKGLLLKEWIASAQADPTVYGACCTVSKSNLKSRQLFTTFGCEKSSEDLEILTTIFPLKHTYPKKEIAGSGVRARTATLGDLTKLMPLLKSYCAKMQLSLDGYTRAM